MATKKKKVEEEAMQTENSTEMISTEAATVQIPKRIVLGKDTELRKFPTLQKEHVVRIGKAGTGYTIQNTASSVYGRFYKLDNGNYIVKDGKHTII